MGSRDQLVPQVPLETPVEQEPLVCLELADHQDPKGRRDSRVYQGHRELQDQLEGLVLKDHWVH